MTNLEPAELIIRLREYARDARELKDYDLACDILGAIELLEQPKQEPVAWMTEYGNIMHANTRAKWVEFDGGKGCERFSDYAIPLFTAPTKREWVGLTDEEIDSITGEIIGWNSACGWEADYARAIEFKLKEKNT